MVSSKKTMKTFMRTILQSKARQNVYPLILGVLFTQMDLPAQGIPEPSIILYGVIRNLDDGGVPLIAGSLRWQFRSPAGGPTITAATTLTNINSQYSYILRIPLETDIGTGISSNALRLTPASIPYDRASVFVGTNRAAFAEPSLTNLTVSSLDRGRIERVDLQVSIPCVDSFPANSLCDWWELAFFGYLGVDPTGDADGDGLNNLAERQAGTDPTDSNSVFRVEVDRSPAGGSVIQWNSAEGRVYDLYRSTNLLSIVTANLPLAADVTLVMTNVLATPPRNVFVDTNAPSNPNFYRLRLP
jgi:hypothetical protein